MRLVGPRLGAVWETVGSAAGAEFCDPLAVLGHSETAAPVMPLRGTALPDMVRTWTNLAAALPTWTFAPVSLHQQRRSVSGRGRWRAIWTVLPSVTAQGAPCGGVDRAFNRCQLPGISAGGAQACGEIAPSNSRRVDTYERAS